MAGESNLSVLLKSMQPNLLDTRYVFISLPQGKYGDGAHLNPIGMFMEEEGLTLIVPSEAAAQNNLAQESVFACISLQVHSSLEAVGLTAAFADALASRGISANVVAGFYHDHIFVADADAQAAVEALQRLAQEAQ